MNKFLGLGLSLMLAGLLAACGQSSLPQATTPATDTQVVTDSADITSKTPLSFTYYQPSQLNQAVREHPEIEDALKKMGKWDEAVKNADAAQMQPQGVPVGVPGTDCTGYISTEFVPSGLVQNVVGVFEVYCYSGINSGYSTVAVVNQRDSTRAETAYLIPYGNRFKGTAQRKKLLATYCTYASATLALPGNVTAFLAGVPYNGIDCK